MWSLVRVVKVDNGQGVLPGDKRRRLGAAFRLAGLVDELNSTEPQFGNSSMAVLERRYLSKDHLTGIVESVDDMFRRVAGNLSQADLKYDEGEDEDREKNRQLTCQRFYEVMRSLDLLPNSPTLMNAGRDLQQLSACFVLPVDDSIDSIFSQVKATALIHKSGGGTGFSFTRLRPAGDVVGSTGGVASGPVTFIRAFDTATDVVKQGGTRRGANMGILNVDHPDILEFIRSKKDGLSLQNFNISVAVTDDYMDKVASGEDYSLVNPTTKKVVGQLNAREVFEELVHMAWWSGDPGLVFIDRINEGNPNPHLGRIESTNPCGEQPLLPYESCNLASINLARMVLYDGDLASVDWERLDRTVDTAVHLLDNVIDMNQYPLPEIAAMSLQTRRIGVGVMGLADLLVLLGIRYDSTDALDLAVTVMKRIQDEAYWASIQLARTRGTFPAWEGSVYSKGNKPIEMRNSAPVTIAPTGTISIIAGASSGIEPLFALSFVRNVMDHTRLVEVNPYFEAVARYEGFYSEELMQQLAHSGSLEDLEVPAWVKQVFRSSHDITPEWHVKIQGVIQQHVDNAVSKTINFPFTALPDDVGMAYQLAYDLGCKGITIYRDGSKADQVLSVESGEEVVHSRLYVAPRARPKVMHGVTECVPTGHGNLYVTVNFDGGGQPFEVFSVQGKSGGCDSAQLEAISRMVSLSLRSGVSSEAVVAQLQGITCCPRWVDGEQVLSSSDAIARVLRQYMVVDVELSSEVMHLHLSQTLCSCGGKVEILGNCPTCLSCGDSKCD